MATKVVVVDDEYKIGVLCRRILEKAGMEAASFTDPAEALDHIASKGADVVLTDVRMPVIDGFEVIKRIRACCPSTAVVVMTAYGELDIALKALHSGADGMILKPFQNNTALVEAVQEGLHHRRKQEETAQLHALLPLLQVAEVLLSKSAGGADYKILIEQAAQLFPEHDFGVYSWEGEKGKCLAANAPLPTDEATISRMRAALIEQCEENGCALSPQWLTESGWSDAILAGVFRGERLYAILLGRKTGNFAPVDRTTAAILSRLIASALENSRLYTELQRSWEKERRSQEALAKAKQLASLGRMMKALAHEFNNPLQTLRNSLYLAVRAKDNPEKREEFLEIAYDNAERLSTIAQQMMDFYRPHAASRELISLAEFVRSVINEITPVAQGHGIEVTLNLPPNSPKILAVPEHIRQALHRLVKDLLETAPPTAHLHIALRETDNEVVLEISASPPDEYAGQEEKSETETSWETIGTSISEGIISAHGGTFSASMRGGKKIVRIVLPTAS